ncbi:MAG: helix-turn-helix transcriptional regulator [Acidimicrobiales bacterium]
MTTRRELLLLLRTHPGITVHELAGELRLSEVAVRRHLDILAADHIAEHVPAAKAAVGAGRRASGWRLSESGLELFPRRYDALALELLEDLAEEAGPQAVDAVFERRTDKLASQYETVLEGVTDTREKVRLIASLRDQGGYLTDVRSGEGDEVILVENNCAVHKVAERHSVVCDMELVLFRRVLGPDVEVQRVAHTMSGDPVCCYRVCPRSTEGGDDS